MAKYSRGITSKVSTVETKIPKISEIASPLKIGSSKIKNAPIIAASPVSAAQLAALVARIADNTISNNAGKQLMDALWAGEAIAGEPQAQVDALIESKGLKQMNDSGALEAIVDEVLAANEKNVAEYRAGKEKAFNALVGQVMKASKGKANPGQVNEVLKARLG